MKMISIPEHTMRYAQRSDNIGITQMEVRPVCEQTAIRSNTTLATAAPEAEKEIKRFLFRKKKRKKQD